MISLNDALKSAQLSVIRDGPTAAAESWEISEQPAFKEICCTPPRVNIPRHVEISIAIQIGMRAQKLLWLDAQCGATPGHHKTETAVGSAKD